MRSRLRDPSNPDIRWGRTMSFKSNVSTLTLTFLLGLSATAALAQETLPELVISASQTPLEADRVGTSNTVLKGDDLGARGFTSVADALRIVPGVVVTPSGSTGGVTQVRIRGGEANHLQVYIDDVPVANLSDLGFDFADYQLDDIDRIEILRGPQSGIYGSSAHSGVISIYTKSGRGLAKPEVTARAEYGSRGTSMQSLSARGSNGPLYGAVTVQNFSTNGYNIARNGTENDDHRSYSVTAKVGADVNENLNIEGSVRSQRRFAQLDPSVSSTIATDGFQYDTFQNTSARLAATHKAFDGHLVQRLGVYSNQENYSDNIPLFAPFNYYATKSNISGLDYKASLNYNLGSLANTTSLFVDKRTETFKDSNGIDAERSRTGVALEHVVSLATGLSLSGALRRDFNDTFADTTTWRFTASQKLGESGTRLHSSIGKGVTNPTFNEMYSAFSIFVPNPGLQPESSVGWDFGVEQTWVKGVFVTDVTYFASRFRDMISTIVVAPGMTQAVNLPGISPREGIEVALKYTPYIWLQVDASYTYTDAHQPDGLQDLRRPRNSGSLSATVKSLDQRTRFTANMVYNGIMQDFFSDFITTSRVSMPGYTVVNAILSYDLNANTTLYVRGDNIFDRHYETIYGFRGQPATYLVGMKMKL